MVGLSFMKHIALISDISLLANQSFTNAKE